MQGLEKQDGQWCRVEITPDALNPTDDMEWVSEPCCGAICSFVGITRDTFEGRKVVTLEYEAYKNMAEHTLRALCQTGKQRWEIEKMSVRHRIGRVDVGEASVVIVVSSKHRKEGLECCAWAIDELKATVPIWKKEVYEEGQSLWKENAEGTWS